MVSKIWKKACMHGWSYFQSFWQWIASINNITLLLTNQNWVSFQAYINWTKNIRKSFAILHYFQQLRSCMLFAEECINKFIQSISSVKKTKHAQLMTIEYNWWFPLLRFRSALHCGYSGITDKDSGLEWKYWMFSRIFCCWLSAPDPSLLKVSTGQDKK
jgi:hypothetical protein